MYRKIEDKLKKWKKNFKKPFMLIGPRQTGKTYIVTEFCKNNFDNFLYFDVKKDTEISDVFEKTIDPEKIINSIELIKGITIDVENTVIFFDEVQVSERLIESLKYFCDSDKNYKIIVAGSLLGVKINRFNSSFPVGKVSINYLYPMDFEEFLLALGKERLVKEIKEHYNDNTPILDSLHENLLELYKNYLVIGGMPEVVSNYISNNSNLQEVDFSLQNNIVVAYIMDMNKYTYKNESIKINATYKTIPLELARENKVFKFSLVDVNARYSRFKSSLEWLVAGNMVIKCDLTNKAESPLSAYQEEETFKLYLSDVGLLRSLSNIDYREIIFDKNIMFKGALTENYVAQELVANENEIFFYKFNRYEIDFLIKLEGEVIPVEVKSGNRTNSVSLNNYVEKYKPVYAIRISTKNFGFENNIKSVPLYAVFCIK